MPYTSAAAYAEEAWSVKETFDSFGGVVSASVTLRCAWADRYTIVSDILGSFAVWPQGTGSTALASKATIRPAPNSKYVETSGVAVYEQALIDLVYQNQSQDGSSGAQDSVTNPGLKFSDAIETTVDAQKLDPKQFRWDVANGRQVKLGETPTRHYHGIKLARTIYGFTTLPASILTLPGKTNLAAYTSAMLGLTFAAETLLFEGLSVLQNVYTDGSVTRNATVKWVYKNETWNKFWNAEAQAYQKLWDADYNNGAGRQYNNYPPIDMSDYLFT